MKFSGQAIRIVHAVLKDYDAPTSDFTDREAKILEALYDCAEGIVQTRRELDNLKAKTGGSVNE